MTAAHGWVGCLVLAGAPQPHMAQVVEGVRWAEAKVLDDPVLADTARVATTGTADPLAGDLDDVAHTLHGELLDWSLSPARNPAPRSTFCLLVVHPDAQEADQLVRRLAETSTLSQLPVTFRVGEMQPEATGEGEVARMILDAVDATARGLEREPGFWLTREQLGRLADRRNAAPKRVARAEPQAVAPAAPALVPLAWSAPTPPAADPPDPPDPRDPPGPPAEPAGGGRHAAPPDPDPPVDLAVPIPAGAADLETADDRADGPSALGRFVSAARSRLSRRVVPASNVEIIEELSGRSDRVSMLYLVTVSEPVRPSGRDRARRTEVALGLARAFLSLDDADGSGPWFVRAFTADRHLRSAPPLPGPDQLRPKDLPEHWGEYFELFDGVDDLLETIGRDSSSFRRRGGREPDAFVVFLASNPPTVSADRDRRLARLCEKAVTIWVSFAWQLVVTDEEPSGRRLHFLRDHEDAVDQLCRILLAEERFARRPQRMVES